jgi:hypothetical protein
VCETHGGEARIRSMCSCTTSGALCCPPWRAAPRRAHLGEGRGERGAEYVCVCVCVCEGGWGREAGWGKTRRRCDMPRGGGEGDRVLEAGDRVCGDQARVQSQDDPGCPATRIVGPQHPGARLHLGSAADEPGACRRVGELRSHWGRTKEGGERECVERRMQCA